MCAGCKQRIYDEQYLQALNTDWHTVCFRYVEQQQQQDLLWWQEHTTVYISVFNNVKELLTVALSAAAKWQPCYCH